MTPAGSGPPAGRDATTYDQLLRTPTYAWWKPVVGVVLALLAYVVLAALVLSGVALVAASFQAGSFSADYRADVDVSQARPVLVLGLDLAIASFIPVTWLLVRVLHGLRPRRLSSVAPGLRWRFLVPCLGVAVAALAAQVVVGRLLPHTGDALGGANPFTATVAWTVVVIVLTTPLQAAGEEYLFRGFLLGAFGSLFRNRWAGIVVSALLFALAHGVQNPPLFLDRLAFGLLAGYLVVRTGGLEAGIALHVVNNGVAFGLALAFGDLGDTLGVRTVPWTQVALTVTQSGTYLVLVLLLARRADLQTTTAPRTRPEVTVA